MNSNNQICSHLVVHCQTGDYDLYIGRPSKWGNPFVIGKDGTREEVIKKFIKYLLDSPKLMNELPELKDKVLGCWCAPKVCHGNILATLANWDDDKNNRRCNLIDKNIDSTLSIDERHELEELQQHMLLYRHLLAPRIFKDFKYDKKN
jgi:hypothetical protein